jgi:hypothetical protein
MLSVTLPANGLFVKYIHIKQMKSWEQTKMVELTKCIRERLARVHSLRMHFVNTRTTNRVEY